MTCLRWSASRTPAVAIRSSAVPCLRPPAVCPLTDPVAPTWTRYRCHRDGSTSPCASRRYEDAGRHYPLVPPMLCSSRDPRPPAPIVYWTSCICRRARFGQRVGRIVPIGVGWLPKRGWKIGVRGLATDTRQRVFQIEKQSWKRYDKLLKRTFDFGKDGKGATTTSRIFQFIIY